MNKVFAGLLFVAIVSALPGLAHAQAADCITTVILLRHADRDGDNDALTDLGMQRAQDFARVVSEAGATVFFTTDKVRTTETIRPAADQAAGVEPPSAAGQNPLIEIYDDPAALKNNIMTQHRCNAVVVAGHSNTLASIMQAFGVESPPDVTSDQFDRLFIISVADHTAHVTRLRYGASTE